jgi:hypothetical protein
MIRRNVTESTFISTISALMKRADDLSCLGTLSRRGALRRAVKITNSAKFDPNSRFLIDHNENKLFAAQKLWGELAFVSPYGVAPQPQERLALILSQVLRDRPRRVLQGMFTMRTLKRRLPLDSQIYVWNPTQIFHHCIIEYLGSNECMIFNPIIPLPSRSESYAGRKLVMDVYNIPQDKFREVPPDFIKSDQPPRVAIYLSKLPDYGQVRNRAERRLIEFGRYLIDLGVETRFFLHYRDRSSPSQIRRFGLPEDFCDFGESLQRLAKVQISISGCSTIGLDLASADSAHFFCVDTDRPGVFRQTTNLTPLAEFLTKSARNFRDFESNEEWISKIEANEPIVWGKIVRSKSRADGGDYTRRPMEGNGACDAV